MRSQPDPFPNGHNICYFNALLQCILAAVNKKSFLTVKSHQTDPINIITLIDLDRRLRKKKYPSMEFGQQQCAGEMYTMLMTAYEDFPLFTNLFFYETNVVIICTKCRRQKNIFERENIITIGNFPDAIKSIGPNTESIEHRCESCSSNQAVKFTNIRKPAHIMVFQVKINNEPNRVEFPEKIHIDERTWEIRGLVHHFGNQESGHYVACLKLGGEWWIADDEKITNGRMAYTSAFLAFYSL